MVLIFPEYYWSWVSFHLKNLAIKIQLRRRQPHFGSVSGRQAPDTVTACTILPWGWTSPQDSSLLMYKIKASHSDLTWGKVQRTCRQAVLYRKTNMGNTCAWSLMAQGLKPEDLGLISSWAMWLWASELAHAFAQMLNKNNTTMCL